MQTGEALVRYLQYGRPDTINRTVFVRQIAPYDKPISAGTITDLVRYGFVRAGLGERFHGVHVLRRTTHMFHSPFEVFAATLASASQLRTPNTSPSCCASV